MYDSPGSIEIGGGTISSYDGNSLGTTTLAKGFAYSSNVMFAQVGEQLGAANLVNIASQFGFNKSITTDFSIATSLMPDSNEMTLWETAWAACGQPVGEHKSPAGPQATVVQMAMVAAGIANGGSVMTPYVVKNVTSPQGAIVTSTSQKVYSQVCSAETATQVYQAMYDCVDYGTGTGAKINGATVVGKTGTAQTSSTTDNSWFIGTATANGRSVTIAIVVENMSESVTYKAGYVMQQALVALGAL